MSDLQSYGRTAGWLGRAFRYDVEVTSTNDIVLAAGRSGVAQGFVAVAEVQTAGRGRLGRQWLAPAGTCLLMSMLFHPPDPFSHNATRTTMLSGLALAEAVRETSGVEAQLKWPNDLIVSSGERGGEWRKLAGMLTEIGLTEQGQPAFIVVGIGLNVNVTAAELPGLGPDAASLLTLSGSKVDRVRLLDRLLPGIERRYEDLLRGKDPFPAWRASLAWLGQPVEVRGPQECLAGVAEGVDEDGSLRLRQPDGEVRRLSAGDVSLRPAEGEGTLPGTR